MDKVSLFTFTYLCIISIILVISKQRRFWLLASLIFPIPFINIFIHAHYLIIYAFFADRLFIIRHKSLKKYLNNYINISLFIFYIVCIISGFFASNWSLSVGQLVEMIYYYNYFILILRLISTEYTQLNKIVFVLTICFVVSSFIQFLQVLGYESFNIYNESNLNPNTQLNSSVDFIRYWGPFGNSLTYSAYLATIGIFIFIFYSLKSGLIWSIVGYSLLSLTIVSTILTVSRTAAASIVIAFIFYLIIIVKKRKLAIFLVSFFLIFVFTNESLFVNKSSFMIRMNDSGKEFKDARLTLWIKGYELFTNNLFFGTGPGNLNQQLNITDKRLFDFSVQNDVFFKWGHVENVYLTVLYTYGLAGFVIFAYVLIMIVKHLYKMHKYYNSTLVYEILPSKLLIVWIVIMINMITNPAYYFDIRMTLLTIFFLAITLKTTIDKGLRVYKYIHN